MPVVNRLVLKRHMGVLAQKAIILADQGQGLQDIEHIFFFFLEYWIFQ